VSVAEIVEGRRERLPWIVFTASLVVVLFAITWRYYIDDLYIYGTFARHFFHGRGFTFNLPDGPTYGMTGPLFVVLLAPFAAAGTGAVQLGGKLIGALATLGAVWSLGLTLERANGERTSAWGVALLSMLGPLSLRWMVCGLETPLAVLCIAEAGRACLSGRSAGSVGRRVALWTMLGLFLRPEFVVVLGVIFGLFAMRGLGLPPTGSLDGLGELWTQRRSWIWLCAPLLVYAGWLLYCAVTFGQIEPNTVLAKGGARDSFSVAPFTFLRNLAIQGGLIVGPTLGLLAALGLGGLLAGKRLGQRVGGPTVVFGAVAVAILFGYWVRNGPLSGRYLSMFLTLPAAAAAAAGLGLIAGWRPRLERPVLVLAASLTLLPWPWVFRHMTDHARGNEAMHRAAAELGAKLGGEERIVAADVGVIAWASERPVDDIHGLVSPEFIGRRPSEILAEKRPGWFVLRPHQLRAVVGEPPIVAHRLLERVHYPSFKLSDREGDDYLVGRWLWSDATRRVPEVVETRP